MTIKGQNKLNKEIAGQNPMNREFDFSRTDFDSIRARLSEHAGIVLSDIKQDMVYNRLARRLRVLGLADISGYLKRLDDPIHGDEEFVNFINALTTNLTSFFREPHHFRFMAEQLLPQLQQSKTTPIRIWSAGCSIGEEAYTIAMTLDQALQDQHPAKILATDINTSVLEVAQHGIYDEERIHKLDPEIVRQGFLRGKGQNKGMIKVKPAIRSLVHFKQLNLIRHWPMQQAYDIIFCRNVMIYFDKETQTKLINRMADLLTPNGHLFVGHSESLHKVSDRFEAVGQTIYRRVG